jgi:putative hydrolase of the HAD superfamily
VGTQASWTADGSVSDYRRAASPHPYPAHRPLLDAEVFSARLGAGKPDSALFLTACRRLGVAPRQCSTSATAAAGAVRASAVGMIAVRLAAPDLADHLVFDRERDWTGPCVDSLTATLDLALGSRSPRLAR